MQHPPLGASSRHGGPPRRTQTASNSTPPKGAAPTRGLLESTQGSGCSGGQQQHREYNRAANMLAQLAHSTGHDTEWPDPALQTAGEVWHTIAGSATDDVKQWLQDHAKSTEQTVVEVTV
ncbi:hypothetical protein PR003_g2134 [Phytophthora rubi]|uniref:Uncharacterized protein n=1 Tax=Phytophthora rubi TaxID=129364 RepID=A0A6A4G6E5_9STRA|nr:hypothetical protein PR003_g2134 [Phytophthora rubi]